MNEVKFKPLVIKPLLSKYFYLLQSFTTSIKYALMLELIEDIKRSSTICECEDKKRILVDLRVGDSEGRDFKYCKLLYLSLLADPEESNEGILNNLRLTLKSFIEEGVEVNIREEDEDNILSEGLRIRLNTDSTFDLARDIREVCKSLITSSNLIDGEVFAEDSQYIEKEPRTSSRIFPLPSMIIYNLLNMHTSSLKPVPSLITKSLIHNILYRYAVKYIKEGKCDYSSENHPATTMGIEIKTGGKMAKTHKSLLSYVISLILRKASYNDVSDEFLDIDKLNTTLINLYKYKPEVIVRVLTKLHSLEEYLCRKEEHNEELCRDLKYYLKDLIEGKDNQGKIIHKLISEHIPKILSKQPNRQKLNPEEKECLGYLLNLISAFKFLRKACNRYIDDIILYLSHNLLNVLIMINAWENFMIVIPSAVIEIHTSDETLKDIAKKINDSKHEIDLIILGWIPKIGTKPLMEFIPTLTFIETKLYCKEEGKITEEGKNYDLLSLKLSNKEEQLINILNIHRLCCNIADTLCRATLAVPRDVLPQPSEEPKEESETIPVICLEDLIDPSKFMATLYTLHTYKSWLLNLNHVNLPTFISSNL